MRNIIKIIMIMVVVMLPLSMAAQDVTFLVKLSEEYSKLEKQIAQLNDSIKYEEDKSFALRSSWYNTCKTYLQKGQFKAEELESLINQTILEIDGQELFDELKHAKECFDNGKRYRYQNIPAPTRTSVGTPFTSQKSTARGSNNKNAREQKKQNPPSAGNKEDPADEQDATPTHETPIVTDPSKDRNGEDKPAAPVKEYDKETPVVSDPKPSIPSKEEKKHDKGEMDEGTSKKSKNSDGSR